MSKVQSYDCMKSFFILPLNVHLIKLLKIKGTPKLGMMKLYLKQLKNKSEKHKHLTKSLVSEALAVISGCCND